MTENDDRVEERRKRVETERERKIREAVHDVPDPDSGRVTSEDVDTLRKAGFRELAEIAERYV